ncbi:MAG: T9SS type A sorting domain-containing protein [Ignavibacteria bacterium]|nr:T9SS type A sorting domain-containing protein [Ignavibacteria bacterium]
MNTNCIIFKRMIFSAIMIVSLFPAVLVSQSPGNPVSIAGNHQTNPAMTTDGSGGTIIVWQDNRNGKYEIYAQRMNGDGNALWTLNGLAICVQDSNFKPMIVSDGSGGAIIAWQSYRGSATADIYAQRVNSSGNIMWSLNGLPVCVVVFEQDTISMVSDGLGGAILTWQDYRSNNGFADIYAQRVNPSGTMIWTANGVNICNQAASQRGPKIISDGSGGAFITWYDNRAGNYDIYSQRVGAAGAVQWTTNGVATCTMAADQLTPDVAGDGADGVIITWTDYRSSTDFNIYAQRVGPSGAIVWVVDGVVMNNNVAYAQTDPMIVSDGLGGAIISWTDYRTGTTADIYAQRVNSTGAVQWTATGVIICTASGDQIFSQLTSDGNNGAYITWEDHRNAGNSDIYAQRIASNAALNWVATGYEICTVANDQLRPYLVSNGNLGAIVVWQDYRSGSNFDIYEVGFNTSGIIGIDPFGNITPDEYSLSQNYPNPFNPVTIINYGIKASGNVKISVYDILGEKISVLLDEVQNAGEYSVTWDASGYPSGVYFYMLESGSFTSNKKMILIK